jgi:hypothetical protein
MSYLIVKFFLILNVLPKNLSFYYRFNKTGNSLLHNIMYKIPNSFFCSLLSIFATIAKRHISKTQNVVEKTNKMYISTTQ